MPDFDEINPHLGLWQSENYVSPSERAWERWVAKTEKLLGHNLDGDEKVNGYSLDEAFDYFDAGTTPAEYVEEIKARPNYSIR